MRPDRATWRTLLSQSRYLGRPDVAELVSLKPILAAYSRTPELKIFQLSIECVRT